MSFIIDPNSASFSEIRDDILEFLESAPDADKWKDFFASSTGQTVVDMIAGLGTFLTYNSTVARRESYLRFAENESSNIAIAQTLGYSSFRGRNPVINVNVTPNTSGLLERFFVIGSVGDKDLILTEDVIVNADTPIDLECIVGNLAEEEITVEGDGPLSFRFTQDDVSEDVRVFLNDAEVEVSDRVLDLINGKFVTQSNPLGSVDVKYLNLDNFDVQYDTSDIVKLEWVQRADSTVSESDIVIDVGDLNNFETVSIFQDKESITSIKVNAPLQNETQFIVRGREDFVKILKLLDTSLIDTNARDVSPAVVEIVGLRDDLSLFTDLEKTNIINQIDRPFGVQPPTMGDASPVFLTLSVDLVVKATGDSDAEARTIMAASEELFELQLDFEGMEEDFEDLSFVKVARITIKAETREDSTFYKRGDTIVPATPAEACENIVWEMTRIIYKSGTTEPDCPSEVGEIIIDGQIVWTAVDPNEVCICDPEAQLPLWSADTDYELGDRVRLSVECDYILEVTDFINLSNFSQEIQRIDFSATPTEGTYRIETSKGDTTDIPYDAVAQDVEDALVAAGWDVNVTGDNSSGFEVEFQGDDANQNVDEFTFDDEGQNEIQCLQPNLVPDSGNWQLEFGGDTTSVLDESSDASAVQSALEALPSIGAGNVQVSGTIATRFLIEFVSDLGTADQDDIDVVNNTLVVGTTVAAVVTTDTEGRPVDAGENEVQTISFDSVPTDGNWSLTFDDKTTTLLSEATTASELEDALEALDSIAIGNVTVTGNFTDGFVVTFVSALGLQDVSLIEVAQNELSIDQAVVVTPSTVQEGGGGNDEVQRIDFDFAPDAGQWKIEFDGEETDILSSGETSQTVETALESLSNIGSGNIEVTGDFSNGFILNFTGTLANTDVAEVTISFNTLTIDQPVDISVEETTPGREVDAGEDEVQTISFDFVPDSGNFQIEYDGETTANIAYTASAATVETELEALSNITDVDVTGNFTDGFTVTFQNADGKTDQVQMTIASNSLSASSAPVTFDTCGEAVEGTVPANNTDVDITPSTSTGGVNPEPDWPGAVECPV